MTGPRLHHAAVIAAAMLALTACTTSPEARTPAAAVALPRDGQPVDLDPDDFTPGSDHRWFPLPPGHPWVYREADGEGGLLRVVVTVSARTTTVANGVEARVVRDTATESGRLVEDTLDWYAQDSDGNVWYLGEETAEFEDRRVASREGSFEAGVDGALPGIIMPAEPSTGTAYRQEWYDGEAEDRGEVLAVGQQVETGAGHYTDAVLTADSTPLEPRVLEYKLYAPDVGLVLTLDASGARAARSWSPAVPSTRARPVGRPRRRWARRTAEGAGALDCPP